MSYNSYVILDEKVAVLDTVDGRFGGEWLGNLEKELSGRTPDYLVVQHMEPDHSANIAVFAEKYPSAKIVASKQAFVMMKQFFGTDYADRQVVAAEKDTLELGKHTLNFIAAPMVHWPEVIMTYDSADKVLFTADGFGKFGALDAAADAEWDCEARRYYFGIVGKYGAQVQAVHVTVSDLARDDWAECLEDAFRYGKLVLAAPTYNADVFPAMKEFINHLTERNYQNRTIGIIENGSWAPMAAKVMKGMFEKSKNITFAENTVTVRSAVNAANEAQIEALAEELKG